MRVICSFWQANFISCMIQTQGKHGEIISSFNKHLLCVGVFKGYMQYRKLLNVLCCLYRDRDSCKFLVFSSVFIFAPGY